MAAAPGLKPIYQDFEPSIQLKAEEDCDIVLVSLPGFTKDRLRVQLTTSHNLRISGERPLGNNIWSRFEKQFPVSSNCDTAKITAKFDNGILQIRQPKIITPADQQEDKKPKPVLPSKETPPTPTNSPDKQPNLKPKPAEKEKEKEPLPTAANVMAQIAEKEKEAIARAANEKAKTAEKEKESIARAEKEKEVIANEKAKREELAANIKRSSISSTDVAKGKAASEEHEKYCDALDRGGDSGYVKSVFQKYKQVVSGQLMELKKPRQLMKFAVGVLLALAFGFYVTNSVKSYVKSN